MLSSGTCFLLSMPFMAPMLLYFYMIHISLQPPALTPVLSIYKKYIPFTCLFSLWESIELAPDTHDIY